MRHLFILFFALALSASASATTELTRERNKASTVVFHFFDSTDGTRITNPATVDCNCEPYQDGTSYDGTETDCTTAEDVDTGEGHVSLDLTATELNNDFLYVFCTSTATNSMDRAFTINTHSLFPTTESQDNIDVTSTGEVGLDLGNTSGTLDAAEIGTDAITGDELSAAAVDEIWAEVLTELSQAAPSATPAVRDAIMALYMVLRNEVTVDDGANEKTFSNDAGTVIFKKGFTDNGTTYTETEAETGP